MQLMLQNTSPHLYSCTNKKTAGRDQIIDNKNANSCRITSIAVSHAKGVRPAPDQIFSEFY